MTHPFRLASALLLTAGLSTAGCVMMLKARVYNLQTAEVIQATFRYTYSGKGPVSFALPAGEVCAGEYVTVAGGTTEWGAVFATVYSGSASASAAGTSSGGSIENKQKGSAVATCADGRVFDCEYVTSASSVQGYGACKDNRGQSYRLMF